MAMVEMLIGTGFKVTLMSPFLVATRSQPCSLA